MTNSTPNLSPLSKCKCGHQKNLHDDGEGFCHGNRNGFRNCGCGMFRPDESQPLKEYTAPDAAKDLEELHKEKEKFKEEGQILSELWAKGFQAGIEKAREIIEEENHAYQADDRTPDELIPAILS